MTPAMLRYLRTINAQHQARMFAGNHNVRRMLEEAGYIEVVKRVGQWYQLRPTEKGIAALKTVQS